MPDRIWSRSTTTAVSYTTMNSHLNSKHRMRRSQLRLIHCFAAPALTDPRSHRDERKSASIDDREAHGMVSDLVTTAAFIACAGRSGWGSSTRMNTSTTSHHRRPTDDEGQPAPCLDAKRCLMEGSIDVVATESQAITSVARARVRSDTCKPVRVRSDRISTAPTVDGGASD